MIKTKEEFVQDYLERRRKREILAMEAEAAKEKESREIAADIMGYMNYRRDRKHWKYVKRYGRW